MKRLVWLLVICLNVHAQEPQDVVRISTNLVQVDVVVTKDGKQITDLKPEDFEIFEDGRRQQITNFAYVSVAPATSTSTKLTTESVETSLPKPPLPHEIKRTVAIVVDDLGMSFESMASLRRYLSKFVSENLSSNDLVAIIRTGGEVGALQQFTTDSRVLANAIADLKWYSCSRVGTSVLAPERTLLSSTPPEGALRPRIRPDRSPTSAQVERANTATESNPCGSKNPIRYPSRAIRFILRGMRELLGRKSMMLISDNLPLAAQKNSPVDFGFGRPVRENANVIDVWT